MGAYQYVTGTKWRGEGAVVSHLFLGEGVCDESSFQRRGWGAVMSHPFQGRGGETVMNHPFQEGVGGL